ncbi:MAG TPA: hypothetical protein VF029_01565 [Actinomycetota bacterium]
MAATLAAGTLVGLTASNVVPASRAHDEARQATANDLKPSECAGPDVGTTIVGGGAVDGTSQPDLIAGSSGPDQIDGRQGNDCILGGGGDDTLRGGPGFDVCVGGPGADTFHNTCDTQLQ